MSTSLESPHKQDILFSLLPGGAYQLGQSSDTAIQTSISLQDDLPLLTVSDLTTHKQIARVIYPMQGATLEACQQNQDSNCDTKPNKPLIRLVLPALSTLSTA